MSQKLVCSRPTLLLNIASFASKKLLFIPSRDKDTINFDWIVISVYIIGHMNFHLFLESGSLFLRQPGAGGAKSNSISHSHSPIPFFADVFAYAATQSIDANGYHRAGCSCQEDYQPFLIKSSFFELPKNWNLEHSEVFREKRNGRRF